MAVSSSIPFTDLCKILETIKNSKKNEKSEMFSKFYNDYKAKGLQMQSAGVNVDTSFYPALRLILPQADRQRGTYGLKETTLSKRLVKILCLPAKGADALRLINFRTNASGNSNIKDFADAAYWILRKHFTNDSKLSINAVNTYLDSIAQKNSDNDPRGVDSQLLKLLQETSAEDTKWLIRIMLKDVRLGIGQDAILRLIHPDGPEYFATNESLVKVCETLVDPSLRLHEIEISLFSPFRPMLSQRCDVVQINKVINENTTFTIENKFDGERFQLHMKDGVFKYFSRNGYDYTQTFGADYSSGIYTPSLKNAFTAGTNKLVLDGEMMGWNTKTKSFGSKGMNFDVKNLTKTNILQPCFCVFDILLSNDKVLTNRPLSERLNILNSIIQPVHGVILVSHHTKCNSKQDIIDALNLSMDNKEEGIVFKDVSSIYKCNDRKAGWWKMKLEYFENVMNDLDVIIMGGYYGEGRRRLSISGFLVGVIDNTIHPLNFLSFAKISTGLGTDELDILNKKLEGHWKKINEGNPEQQGIFWGKEKPDFWIEPQNSCALLVRGSELTYSSDFKVKYTLRFPRILKIRPDKPYQDCFNTTELQEITNNSNTSIKKLNKRHLELDDLIVEGKERKTRRRVINFELKPVEEVSQILVGFQFSVLTGNDNWHKEDIETQIRENGGTIVPIEGPDTLCILVGNDHPRVNTCRSHNAPCDLVKLEWLMEVLDTGKFNMYEPKYMLHTSSKTKLLFNSKYDKYGDSFTEHVDSNSVKELLTNINNNDHYIHLMPIEIINLNKEICYNNPTHIFKNCVGYFDKFDIDYRTHSTPKYPLTNEEVEFKFLGGTLSNVLDKTVSIVIADSNDKERINGILAHLKSLNNITAKIVDKSHISERMVEVKHFLEL